MFVCPSSRRAYSIPFSRQIFVPHSWRARGENDSREADKTRREGTKNLPVWDFFSLISASSAIYAVQTRNRRVARPLTIGKGVATVPTPIASLWACDPGFWSALRGVNVWGRASVGQIAPRTRHDGG